MQNTQRRIIQTTTWDVLIMALTEEAFLVTEDEAEAKELVANILGGLLAKADGVTETWH